MGKMFAPKSEATQGDRKYHPSPLDTSVPPLSLGPADCSGHASLWSAILSSEGQQGACSQRFQGGAESTLNLLCGVSYIVTQCPPGEGVYSEKPRPLDLQGLLLHTIVLESLSSASRSKPGLFMNQHSETPYQRVLPFKASQRQTEP